MEKFRNKYRIPSTRLQNWDYRWAGAYFITICTQDRKHYFGKITDGKMQLSCIGIIADILWHQIPHHIHGVELGEFVVMPNHIHGVLIITQNDDGNGNGNGYADAGVDMGMGMGMGMDTDSGLDTDARGRVGVGGGDGGGGGGVETGHALSLPPTNPPTNETPNNTPNNTPNDATINTFNEKPDRPKTIGQQRFQNIGKNSISSIVGSYKSAVTKHAHRLEFEFQWQTRFHDHIIRDEKSFQRISNYIINNPSKWCDDKFYR